MALAMLKRACGWGVSTVHPAGVSTAPSVGVSTAPPVSGRISKVGLAALKGLGWVLLKPVQGIGWVLLKPASWKVAVGVLALGATVQVGRLFAENILTPIWSRASAFGLAAYTLGETTVTGIGNVVLAIGSIPVALVENVASLGLSLINGAQFIASIPYNIGTSLYDLSTRILAIPAATVKWAGEGIASGISHVASGFIAQVVTKVSGDVSYTMLEKGREAVAEAAKQLTKDITFNVLPYAVVGLTTVVGTPLVVRYLYKKAMYNLGKPALATEMRFVGLESITQRIKAVVNLMFNTVKSGTVWSFGSFLGLNVATAGMIASFYYSVFRIPTPSSSIAWTEWKDYHAATRACAERFLKPIDDHYLTALYYAPVIGFAAGSAWHLGCESWSAIKGLWKRYEPKPLFDEKMSEQIDEIANTTYNLQKNGGFYQNVLLYGPGGTGKTMVANAILKGVQKKGAKINWIKMTGASLAQYIKRGEHITELNRLFEQIKKSSHPTILFIDEIEALAMDRDKMDRSELFELIDTFLSHTGEPSSKFMIIGATNKKELVDSAFLSRMDYKLKIHPPGVTERVRILTQEVKHFFPKNEQQTLLNEAAIQQLAKKSAGLTGRSLCKMVNAIYAKKKASEDGQLTKKMISSVSSLFVSQERAGLSFWTRALYASRLKDY